MVASSGGRLPRSEVVSGEGMERDSRAVRMCADLNPRDERVVIRRSSSTKEGAVSPALVSG